MSSTDHRELLKRALLAVEELQAKVARAEQNRGEPLAIIGMACRIPGDVAQPDQLWHRLRDGFDAIKEVPPDRWDVDRYYDADPDAPGKMYTRWGAFMERIDGFDPSFFRISPREAANMDPQHRILLEVAWEALENAGRSPATLHGSSTGVFVGISTNDYSHYGQEKARASDLASIDCYLGTGNAFCVASGRVSHFLGVQGPCVAVDTACSSSLVAVDLACQHLRSGRCDLALAGGVNAILSPGSTIYFSKARAMAADGRCKTFDAAADGYTRGEGCGVVVLKRLSQARRDRDRILAIVRGSAVNHDGASGGLTVPNGHAQEAVIRAALADGGVEPGEVDYVEAHGTGTPLGDPIEVRALGRVFGPGRSAERPLWLGSIKTNIGHLEAAAGVAGLMKVVLSLRHRQMPAHLHFERPNPHIEWEKIPVRVVQGLRAWEKGPEGRRIAGVSSFGFGGTNAHVVIEEGEEAGKRKGGVDRPLHVVALSARSEEALRQLGERYAKYLGEHGEVELGDVAYTANTGRSHFGYRLAVVGKDGAQVRQRLEAAGKGGGAEGMWRGQVESRPRVTFLFSGQGSQYAGMGRQLYETQPVFRRAIEGCEKILQGRLRWPLTEVMWGERSRCLDETEYTQPAVFALEYGLAQLWRSWGVEPDAVMGHSVGEYVAACVAGVFGLEEGLGLIAQRAALMQGLPQEGEMAAVLAGAEAVEEVVRSCGAEVSIAALNGPGQTVISGLKGGMAAVLQGLRGQGIGVERLKVSHGFHSAQMEGMLEEFGRVAGRIRYEAPKIPLVSNLTGEWLEEAPTAQYWQRHTREAVQFMKGMECLEKEGFGAYLEVGPQPVLLGLGQRCGAGGKAAWLGSLRRGRGEWEQMLESAGRLYVQGVELDWRGFDREYERERIELPTYPFQRQRYWLEDVGEVISNVVDTSKAGVEAGSDPALASGPPPATVGDPKKSDKIPELTELLRRTPASEWQQAVVERVQDEVARVLHLSSPPSPRQGFFDMGMDSFMAVELRCRLESIVGHAVPPTIAFDYPNIVALARFLLGRPARSEVPERTDLFRAAEETRQAAVAIVGSSCRFPGGANDPEAFWQLLMDRKDTVCRVPPDRWPVAEFYDPKPDVVGKSYVENGNFLDVPIADFDAAFFGITPREAAAMDPQQRLLLELCWEALEDAGRSPEKLAGSQTGVFVGINANDYSRRLVALAELSTLDAYAFTGNTFSVAAGRISHVLGLHGPCLAVDTACSSSLVAVHLAVRSLRSGECDLALACGVNVMLSPDGHVILSRMHALAPDGRCKAFDASADGYGRGEGGGAVVLRRLSDALKEGDHILAVVKGSAVNHDGPSSGLTVPNGAAQQALLKAALSDAGVSPEHVSFLEAHGTGTPLGDPIEMEAIRKVFCEGFPARAALAVGSVKTNLGHLEAAAGVASLLKTALALKHKQIPGQLHLRQPTPAVAWSHVPVQIPTDTTPWPGNSPSRLAGVSSFGMSGTNAHVVLQEAPEVEAEEKGPERTSHVFAISARSPAALSELAGRYARHLAAHGEQALADIAFTANTGRAHFDFRLAMVAESREELAGRLSEFGRGESPAGAMQGRWRGGARPRAAFFFGGDAARHAGMGRELYETQPVFRDWLGRCAELAVDYLPRPLLSVVYGQRETGDGVGRAVYTKTGLFALEYALAKLWQSWGIGPSVVLGHGVGEFAAACLAGVLELKEAVRLVAEQARLVEELQAAGSGAVHPESIERVIERMRPVAASVEYRAPRLRWISSARGKLVEGAEEVGAEYWAGQIRHPVQLEQAMEAVAKQGCQIHLEMGPGSRWLPRECEGAAGPGSLWLQSLDSGRSDGRRMLESLGRFYAAGADVDWEGFDARFSRRRVPLPTYPFERQRHWIDLPVNRRPNPASGPGAEARNRRFHRLEWLPPDLVRPSAASAAARPPEKAGWLLLGNGDGLSEEIAREFRAGGDECILITPGPNCARQDEFSFTVNPASSEGFVELFGRVIPNWFRRCRGIIHLWSMAAEAGKLEETCVLQCTAILNALQAVVRTNTRAAPRIWLVTRCAAHVPSEPRELSVGQAGVWGMGRAIAWEHPELWGGLIDLDSPADKNAAKSIHGEIIGGTGEDQVAFRGGKRHLARLASDDDCQPASQEAPAIRRDASYLITGGLGSLGMRVAKWLIESGARHLILLGRAAPKPEAQAEIVEMAGRGVEIQVASCDVGNRAQLAAALAEAGRTMPALRGVIHLAGIIDDGVLLKQTAERFVRVMAPKVAGSWNLHELTSGYPLDFFVLFSSVASLLGSPGQANYAAGNAFMDALAQNRRLRGLPAISVNWGPWAEAGMAADLAKRSARRWIPEGVAALSTADGLSALVGLLATGEAQMAVMPVDWARFLSQFPEGSEPRVLERIAREHVRASAPKADLPQPRIREQLLGLPPGERRAQLIGYLQQRTGAVMGLPADNLPDPEQGLFEMGLDSLMAVELKNLLSLASGRDLPASLLFSFPNITALADFLLTEFVPDGEIASDSPDNPDRSAPMPAGEEAGQSEDALMDLLAAEIKASQEWRAHMVNGVNGA